MPSVRYTTTSKKRVRIPLRRGVFEPYMPYRGAKMYDLPTAERHRVIAHAILGETKMRGTSLDKSALSILRRLVALRTLNKRRRPDMVAKLTRDIRYVQLIRARMADW